MSVLDRGYIYLNIEDIETIDYEELVGSIRKRIDEIKQEQDNQKVQL